MMFNFEISNVCIVWLVTQFSVFVVYFIQMGGECGTKSLVIIKSDLGLMTTQMLKQVLVLRCVGESSDVPLNVLCSQKKCKGKNVEIFWSLCFKFVL
jgi:hypothetical protein